MAGREREVKEDELFERLIFPLSTLKLNHRKVKNERKKKEKIRRRKRD